MAKKSKLLAALDVQQGRDSKLEKQKKLQKQATKREKARPQPQRTEAEIENEDEERTEGDIPANGAEEQFEDDSAGWESDESEDAIPPTVGGSVSLECALRKNEVQMANGGSRSL